MKINEIVEMRLVGKPPSVSTVDRSNVATKAAIMKQAAWYDKFQKADNQEKFKQAYEKSKKSSDRVEVTLIDHTTGIKEVILDNKIESFDPTTGEIVFLKKMHHAKEMFRLFANINDADYTGRISNTGRSPYKYMFEIPFSSTNTQSEPNLDFKSFSTSGPRRAFHRF